MFDALDAIDERPDPIEDEHLAIFACPGYASARKAFQDLFGRDIATVGQFLSQRDCNRIAMHSHRNQIVAFLPSLMGYARPQTDSLKLTINQYTCPE